MDLQEYCKRLPKTELHAHLSGSVSDSTVLSLLNAKKREGSNGLPSFEEITVRQGSQRTLEDCFALFGIMHSLTDSLEAVRTMTQDVIQEFILDNVRHLELRTTPKAIPGKMAKKDYMDTVLQVIVEAMERSGISVRLMLSIDRGRGVEDAWSTLQLAKDYFTHDVFGNVVCGVDVSGNPRSGDLVNYLPVMQEAKKCGLGLAVHLAEVPAEVETLAILNSGLVNRIGHGTCLHPSSGGSQALLNTVREQCLPLELCISSNLKTGTVAEVEKHHLAYWKEENNLHAICTDDKGVYSTSLSEEFFLCAKTFNFTESDLHELCLNAVEAAFLPEQEKWQLRQIVQKELDALKGKLAA